MASNKIPEM